MPSVTSSAEPRYLNWPNAITGFRALLTPALCSLLWSRGLVAFSLLVVLFFTLDLADGLLARRLEQDSRFGKNFDFLVDSAAALGVFSVLVLQERIPVWFVVPLGANYATCIFVGLRASRANNWEFVPAKRRNYQAMLWFGWMIFPIAGIYNSVINAILVLLLFLLTYFTWEYWKEVSLSR